MARVSRGKIEVEGKSASFVRSGKLDGRPLVVLAHGAGAPMTHPFMEAAAEGLVARDLAVLRFQFPYMDQRTATGTNCPPDRAPVLLATWRAILDRVRGMKGAGPVVMAGKSLGGRMASMLLAEGGAPEVRGAVYLGYPLHPSGQPGKLRDAHLPDVRVPQLFVSGTRDPLCDLALLRPVLRRIGPAARLVTVERGDHSLAVSRSAPPAGAGAWLDAVAAFVREVC